MKAVICMAIAAVMAGSAWAHHHDEDEDDSLESGVINLAATANAMALACGHMSAKDVEAGRVRQRDATIKDLKVPAAQYDRMYAAFRADFSKKWAELSARQQKAFCAELPPP